MSLRLSALLAGVCLVGSVTGCANYRAVSEFADHTTSMTGVVKSEFSELETLCVQQAELVLVVNNIEDDKALAQCEAYKRAQGGFASITVDVLDDYAEGLAALADVKPFDVSPSVKNAGVTIKGLRDGVGNALIGANEADAAARIANLLVEVFASYKRDQAIQRMVQATPDLAVMGRALKAFFVTQPNSSMKAPYVNFVGVITGSTTSTQLILQSQSMRRAEPIRTAELLRALRVRQKLLEKRTAATADAVPMRIGAAIDAWLAALDQFAVDATKPDSRELIDRLNRLRNATRSAKDAVRGN
jgi:hypothetical protein